MRKNPSKLTPHTLTLGLGEGKPIQETWRLFCLEVADLDNVAVEQCITEIAETKNSFVIEADA